MSGDALPFVFACRFRKGATRHGCFVSPPAWRKTKDFPQPASLDSFTVDVTHGNVGQAPPDMTGRRKPGAGSGRLRQCRMRANGIAHLHQMRPHALTMSPQTVGLTRSDRGHGRDQEARMLPAASDAMPWWRVLCGALAAVSRRLEGKRARFIVVAFWKTGAPHRMRRPLWGSRGGAGRMTYAEPSAQVRACRSFLHTTARYREIVDDERYREIVGDERYREVVDDVDTYPPYAVDEDAGMAWNEGSAKDAQKTRIRHGIEARKQPLRLS